MTEINSPALGWRNRCCARSRYRLHHPHPIPAQGHTAGAWRLGLACSSANRYWQDRRDSCSDPASPDGKPADRHCTSGPSSMPHLTPDARARRAGRRIGPHVWQTRCREVDGDLRRRGHTAADRPAPQRLDIVVATPDDFLDHGRPEDRRSFRRRDSVLDEATACSTWASSTTLNASSRCCLRRARACCSRDVLR